MNVEKNNTDQKINEESVVSDLNNSLDNVIEDATKGINKLLKNIESSTQDIEILHETKEILKNLYKDLRESVELTNDKTSEKSNFKEEE